MIVKKIQIQEVKTLFSNKDSIIFFVDPDINKLNYSWTSKNLRKRDYINIKTRIYTNLFNALYKNKDSSLQSILELDTARCCF